jgi:autotransporter translocation and assembly factor TamB
MKSFWKILIVLVLLFKIMIIAAAIWLKTDHAKTFLAQTVVDGFKNEFGLVAKIDNINISLPLIADIDSFWVNDQEGEIGSVKNLHINILPSLFSLWEVTFWSVSAEELTLNRVPKVEVDKNKPSRFFNPSIIIRKLSFNRVNLAPALTALSQPLSFSMNSHLEYDTSRQGLTFTTNGKLFLEKDNSFEILGSYDHNQEQMDIKYSKFSSEIANVTGKLFIDQKHNIIKGEARHQSNFLKQLLNTQIQEYIGESKGEINITGTAKNPRIIATGSIDLNVSPLVYDIGFLLSEGGIEGMIKLDYETMNAAGNIAYKNHKLLLSNFITKGADSEKTANLTLDLNSLILTGNISVIDNNLGEVAKYLPVIHSGAMNMEAVFSSTDNIKQQLSLKGKITSLSTKIFHSNTVNIMLTSLDLWQGKLADLSILVKALNIKDFIFDEVKVDAQLKNEDINVKGNVLSKQSLPINLSFDSVLKSIYKKNIESLSAPIEFVINRIWGEVASAQIKSSSQILLVIGDKTTFKLDNLKIDDGLLNIDASIDSSSMVVSALLKNVPIKPLLTIPGHKIVGRLDGAIKAEGSINDPHLSGQLHLSNGKYDHKQYGIKLKDISTIIKANGQLISFSEILAKDGFGNSLQGDGKVSLIEQYPFSFNMKSKKFNPINTPYMHGELNGNILIHGDKTEATAKGQLTLGPFEIKIPERFKEKIPELNTKEIVIEEDKFSYPLHFNIDLVTTDRVFIRGWGVDTRLNGNLKISGDNNSPFVKGMLNTVRGRYQEFGKMLTIKKGELIFDGPLSPSPFLNIIGVYVSGGTEIRLILSGPIVNPNLAIESTPAMSEERALSFLLFGTNTEDISTFQALQLADGIRRLSGHGGGLDPLGFGRKLLRVDDIKFKTDETNPEKTSIGLGKYVTDKIYFEIERGRQADTTKLRIEVQLTPKISIENVTKQEGNTSLGINWRFDY